jgi:DNA-binding transcriptional LysR family regulator
MRTAGSDLFDRRESDGLHDPGPPLGVGFYKRDKIGRRRAQNFKGQLGQTCVSDSLNLRYSLLETGPFMTMIPESTLRLRPKRASLRVLPIDIPRWRQPTSISVVKNRTLSPMAQAFVHAVREAAKAISEGHAKSQTR